MPVGTRNIPEGLPEILQAESRVKEAAKRDVVHVDKCISACQGVEFIGTDEQVEGIVKRMVKALIVMSEICFYNSEKAAEKEIDDILAIVRVKE